MNYIEWAMINGYTFGMVNDRWVMYYGGKIVKFKGSTKPVSGASKFNVACKLYDVLGLGIV